MIPYLLLAAGLLLIFIEFFLPGGIMGVSGAALVVASIILFAVQTKSPLALVAYIVISIALVAGLIRFTLWRLRRGRMSKSIYLNTDQAGYVASAFAEEYVGKEGVALSDLKPSGHIQVEGKRFQAVSKVGYVYKGTKVLVVGGEGAHLYVKIIKDQK